MSLRVLKLFEVSNPRHDVNRTASMTHRSSSTPRAVTARAAVVACDAGAEESRSA
jgi:hypothetical protein